MKRKLYAVLLVIVVALVIFVLCSRKSRPIPDKVFQQIIKESFLSNAYLSRIAYSRDLLDSIDVYTPIFERYGYTISNFEATMAKYAREKSSRITDILSAVTKELDREHEAVQLAVGREDTIRNRIKSRFSTTLHKDRDILIKSVEDTSKLRIPILIESRGELAVEYSYFLDSLDRNEGLRTITTVTKYGGATKLQERNWLYKSMRDRNEKFTMQMESDDSIVEILLAKYPERIKMPNLKINSVEVTFYLSEEDGFAAMAKEYTPSLHPKYNYTNDWNKEVLSPPRIDIRWLREQKNSDDRPEGADSIH